MQGMIWNPGHCIKGLTCCRWALIVVRIQGQIFFICHLYALLSVPPTKWSSGGCWLKSQRRPSSEAAAGTEASSIPGLRWMWMGRESALHSRVLWVTSATWLGSQYNTINLTTEGSLGKNHCSTWVKVLIQWYNTINLTTTGPWVKVLTRSCRVPE